MQVQVHYQGLDNSPWVNSFIESRVNKLDKYLSPSSSVQINLRYVNRSYVTSLAIHYPHHDVAFNSEGVNLYESLSLAIDKAVRALGEQKQKMKAGIHRKFGLKSLAVS